MKTCSERLAEATYELLELRGFRLPQRPPRGSRRFREWLEEAAAYATAVGRRDVAAFLRAVRTAANDAPCFAAAAVEGAVAILSLVYLNADGSSNLFSSLRKLICRG